MVLSHLTGVRIPVAPPSPRPPGLVRSRGGPMNLRKAPRTLVLTAGYVGLIHVAAGLSLLLRYDGRVPHEALSAWARVAPGFTVLSPLGFWALGLYHGLWRYAGTATVFQVVRGVTLSA